jgi:hypothetical protein
MVMIFISIPIKDILLQLYDLHINSIAAMINMLIPIVVVIIT